MSPRSKSPDPVILSVHVFRRQARKRERELQDWLASGRYAVRPGPRAVPEWVRGVRVEKAGPLQWAVVGTYLRGR